MEINNKKSKKVGIITMHKVHNFGSHLQAYALQEKIRLLGYEVELIDYKYPNAFHETRHNFNILDFFKRFIFSPYYLRNYLITTMQNSKFRDFENKYFHLSPVFNSQDDIEQSNLEYDIYVTGSDQVWNPRFAKGDSIFMLSFVKSKGRKIAFGPSLAISRIPEEYIDIYKECLEKYNEIGVRDNNTKTVLESFLEKEVKRVIDPVFLLPKEDWEMLSKNVVKKYPDKFIFVFILTYSFDPYPEIIEFIKQIKEKYELPVVFFNVSLKRRWQVKPDLNVYYANIEDFLWLIKNADMIITTSFHVTAFSIIFEKQFVAFTNTREKDSRILDLCNDLSIRNCYTLDEFDIKNIYKINYSQVTPNLRKKIGISMEFLDKALGE